MADYICMKLRFLSDDLFQDFVIAVVHSWSFLTLHLARALGDQEGPQTQAHRTA